ncbi:MAG: hypothetical protein O3A77_03175, partial [bacterium]|nr:hypothetical protein [bacterium]
LYQSRNHNEKTTILAAFVTWFGFLFVYATSPIDKEFEQVLLAILFAYVMLAPLLVRVSNRWLPYVVVSVCMGAVSIIPIKWLVLKKDRVITQAYSLINQYAPDRGGYYLMNDYIEPYLVLHYSRDGVVVINTNRLTVVYNSESHIKSKHYYDHHALQDRPIIFIGTMAEKQRVESHYVFKPMGMIRLGYDGIDKVLKQLKIYPYAWDGEYYIGTVQIPRNEGSEQWGEKIKGQL